MKIVKGPCHAFRIQEPPSGSLFSSRLDRAKSSDASTRANLSDRLRHPAVSIRWVADFRALCARACRIHPTHNALASRTASSDLALPDGRVLQWVVNKGDKVRVRVGNLTMTNYDNALAETINGLFKAEVIHRRGPWRSFEAVEYATLEWVDWFNNRRLLEPIGNIPPAEAEANFYVALETEPVAA